MITKKNIYPQRDLKGEPFLGFVSCCMTSKTLLVIIRKVIKKFTIRKDQAFRREGVDYEGHLHACVGKYLHTYIHTYIHT